MKNYKETMQVCEKFYNECLKFWEHENHEHPREMALKDVSRLQHDPPARAGQYESGDNMKVIEYLKRFNKFTDVTFIKTRARKDAHSPFYHEEYQTTPIRTIEEWQHSNIMHYYILNHKQTPIEWLSGAGWVNRFKKGDLLCLLIISKEDIELLYSKEQAEEIIKHIDDKINHS